MIYKYISVKNIIAKVFTDLDLPTESHRVSDMIEWAGEALKKIGAVSSFRKRITGKDGDPFLILSDYQVSLPNDFYKLIQVAYAEKKAGPYYPMRYATGSFEGAWSDSDDVSSTC